MKKTILAVALASLFVGSASAATVYENDNGDNLKIYGGAEVGGTFVSDTDKTPFGSDSTYVDDSFLTLGAKGQTGDIYAKFELDAERTDWTPENNMRLIIDKAYVGYKIAKGHSVEFGRTDTAYDHVDGFGDVTNELGVGISEAGDQDNTLKYRGQFGNVKVGLSHSLEGWDGTNEQKWNDEKKKFEDTGTPKKYSYETDSLYKAVTNGYVGYYGDQFTVIAGAEKGRETEIYSLHAEMKLGEFTIAGLAFDETKNFLDKKGKDVQEKGYNLGGKYALTDQLNLLASYNYSDVDTYKAGLDDTAKWVVVGAEYMYAKNVKLAAEVAYGDVLEENKLSETGTLGYVKAYYWF